MTLFDSLTGTTAQGRLDYIERYTGYYVDELLQDREPESFKTWLIRYKFCNKGTYCPCAQVPSKGMIMRFLQECGKNSETITINGTPTAIREMLSTLDSSAVRQVVGNPEWVVFKADKSLQDSSRVWNSVGNNISDYRWIATDDNGYLGMMELCQDRSSVRKYIKQLNELGIAVVEQR